MQFFVLGIDGPDFGVDDDLNEVHWAYMDRSADALVARGPTRSVDGGHHTGSVHVIELPNALRAAQYTAVPASKGGATPMAFPSGCGLYVYVYKWNNASVGSSLTSCTYAVNYIQHDSNLYRLDWWGWDLRAQGERWTYNASSLALDISDYCSDQNNNSWKNVTWGKLTSGSTNYTATVYDEAYYACGGS